MPSSVTALPSATLDTRARRAYAGVIRRWRPSALFVLVGRVLVLVAATASATPVANAGWARGVVPATAEAPALRRRAAAPAPAAAPHPPPPPTSRDRCARRRRRCYTRGLERFGAHDYAGAIADFEAGYAIEPRREFLFAEGQAKRLAGDCKGAVALYQRFLATNPSSVQANATQMALGRCAQHLADHPDIVVVEPPKPLPPPPPPPPRWWRESVGRWPRREPASSRSASAPASSRRRIRRATTRGAATTYAEADERWSAATSRRTVGVVALGAGSILVAAGAYRFVTSSAPPTGATWSCR